MATTTADVLARRFSRRGALQSAGSAALAVAAAGLLPASPGRAAPRRAGGTAVVAVSASPTSWDLLKSDWVTWQGISSLYDTLLTMDDNDRLQPGLATSWTVTENGLVWDLKLRAGVKFHDGTPFDAEAVKYNFDRHISRTESRYYNDFKWIDRVETPEPLNARIVLKELRADFGYDIAGWGAIQVSPTAHQRLGDRFGSGPVGTGPFKFKAYEPDSHIDLERFDDYWGGRPTLDGVRIRVIPEMTTRLTELTARTIDALYNLDPKDVAAVRASGVAIEQRITPGSQMVTLNTAVGPTGELAVRRAIARAIDRDTIIKKVLYDLPEKSRAGTPSTSPYYHADLAMVDYDPDEAGRILDEAGWKLGRNGVRERDGKPLALSIISTDNNNWGLFNQIVQEQLKEIGIDSTIASYEWGTLLDNWREARVEWHVAFHSQAFVLHATTPLPAAWRPDDFWNICQIKRSTDPALMAAAEELRAADKAWQNTSDVDQRKALARTVQKIYSDQQLTVWMWHTPSLTGISPRLRNYTLINGGRILWFPTTEIG